MTNRGTALALAGLLAGLPLSAHAQASGTSPPHIIAGDMPIYPQIAIAAAVRGVVRLKINVKNGTVTGAAVVSASSKAAEKWLTASARACATSWRFSENTSGTIPVEFIYETTAPGSPDVVAVRFVPANGIMVSLSAARPKALRIRDPSPLRSRQQ
jgi:TonB family protein